MNIILSGGGLDTLCCAHWAKFKFNKNVMLFFDYGQLAKFQEQRASKHIADYFEIMFIKKELKLIEEEPFDPCTIDGSTIQGRNIIFLAHAIRIAKLNKCSSITMGIDGNDSFVDSSGLFGSVARELTIIHGLTLHLPMFLLDKEDYIRENNLPYDLSWSCYLNGKEHCNSCLGCKKREFLNGR